MLRTSARRFGTKWWTKYIDGVNPDDPPRRELAELLRTNRIDPYKLPKELYDDYRRYYLTELNWLSNGDTTKAWQGVVTKRKHAIADMQSQFPLEKSFSFVF
jgi:hypothetical protein